MLGSNTTRAREPKACVDPDIVKKASESSGTFTLAATNRGRRDALRLEERRQGIGRLGAGRSIRLELGFRLPSEAAEAEPLSLMVTVSSEFPGGPERLLHKDAATCWKWTHASGTGNEAFFDADIEARCIRRGGAGRRRWR